MKKILLLLVLMAFVSCEKNFENPCITWKVGIVYDATIQKRNLALEFQSSFANLEEVNFESIWIFEVDGTPIYLELHEEDFSWQHQGRTLKGICKTSLGELLSNPNVIHKSTTIEGHGKIDGKRIRIKCSNPWTKRLFEIFQAVFFFQKKIINSWFSTKEIYSEFCKYQEKMERQGSIEHLSNLFVKIRCYILPVRERYD